MASRQPQSHPFPAFSEDRLIYILGPLHLQNSLIGSFLTRAIGAKCSVIENLNGVEIESNTTRARTLVLWDRFGKNVQDCLLEYEANARLIPSGAMLAFFNLSHGLGIEEKIIPRGVHGFFYSEDPLEQLAKGVNAVFDGELWVSRKIISRYIRQEKEERSLPRKADSILTLRELEILSMVTAGATNLQIAERLFISRHTVKTHLYNIFKKINVPNRLQATLWAAKNL